MPKRSVSYSDWQLEKLADPERAAKYLKVCMQDSEEVFLSALKKVAQANQMAKVAKEAGVHRESLYRSLSEQGNPTYSTLSSVLKVVGLRLTVELIKPVRRPASSAKKITSKKVSEELKTVSG